MLHPNSATAFTRALALVLSLLLAACGGGGDSPPPPPPTVGSATIGAAGGTVDGPDGVRLAVPAGAVATDTTFRIARDSTGAPPLEGINAVSPIYAVTPHGTAFEGQAAFSIPLSAAAALPAGATAVLLKADTGGRWRVLNADARRANALAADVGELSFFVLATCTSTGQQQGWIVDTVACPAQHSLKLELVSSAGTPISVTPGATATQPPTVTVSGPTTLNMRAVWTRAPGTTRADQISVTGSPGGFSASSGFNSSWTNVETVTTDTSRNFTLTIDPSRVAGAGAAGGRVVRVNAYASYSTTVLLIGTGNVPAGFEFTTSMPIVVRHLGTQPQITQQPTPEAVSVVEGSSFSLQAQATGTALTLQWRYMAGAVDAPAEGTNDQPTYQSPPAVLDWNGRLYYLRACSTTGAPAVTTCVNSLASSLTVAAFTQPITFTSQPSPRDIVEGQGTTFGAAVTGTPTPSLRWLIGASCRTTFPNRRTCSGTPLANGAGTGVLQGATVSGSTTATLTLAAVPLTANGAVLVLEAAQSGALTQWSDLVTLTVRAAPVPAGFVQQLASPRTVEQGGSIDFTVVVSGTQPINYKWTIDGVEVTPGTIPSGPCRDAVATFPAPGTLRLTNVPQGCDGRIVAVGIDNVATPAGTQPTSTALLNVTSAAPFFTQQPAAASVDALQATTPATFSFAVRGASGAFTWQWLVNGQPLADGSNVAGNGVLEAATVQGASGSVADGSNGVGGTLTLTQLPLAANGAALSVRVTRTTNAQSYQATSTPAALGVNTTLPPNALTATQVLAGQEWSLVVRPDRTLWAWGGLHKVDGTVQISNLNPADLALRPVRMYPAVLNDVQQIAGWTDSFWALTGTPGSDASQVLHWGNARAGTDGRGTDGNGGLGGTVPTSRANAAPVPLLEQRLVNGGLAVVPVNRVCSFAASGQRLLMIRALDDGGQPTGCAPGAAKTLWVAGTLTPFDADSYGLVVRAPGVSGSPPARVFATQTTGVGGGVIVVLEDGRALAWGDNIGNRFGLAVSPTNAHLGFQGSRVGPVALPAAWGAVRDFVFTNVGLFGLRTDASVAVSGRNDGMELALGPQASSTVNDGPLSALFSPGVPLTGVQALASTASQMSLALIGGRIHTWGYGIASPIASLRGGATAPSGYPSLLATTNVPNSGWQALSASHLHGLAIGPGGAVYSWGYGLRGALGDGVDGSTALEPRLVTQ